MADAKLSALTETTSIDGTEIVYVVEDPAGTPLSRKVTVANLLASLSTTYQHVAEPKVLLFGTSVTNQNGTGPVTLDAPDGPTAQSSRGYWSWASAFLGQRLRFVYNAGIGGNTTAQMLARINTDVLAYDADWVIFEPGPNDPGNDVASATTIANIDTICDLLIAAGRRVCILTPNPSTSYSTSGRKAAFSAVYKHIIDLPLTKPQVVVVDTWRVLVDPATGYPATGMAVDAVHPSEVGAWRMGRAIADVLDPLIPRRRPKVLSLADPDNVIGNPAFTGGTGWSVIGSFASAAYGTLIDRWSSEAVITIAACTDDSEQGVEYLENISGGRFAVGDVVQASARFVFSGMVGRDNHFIPYLRLRARKVDSSFGTPVYSPVVSSSEEVTLAGYPTSGDVVVMTSRMTLPANTDRLYVACAWQGALSGVVRVSDLAVWKGAA